MRTTPAGEQCPLLGAFENSDWAMSINVDTVEELQLALQMVGKAFGTMRDELRSLNEETAEANAYGDEWLKPSEIAAELKTSPSWVYKQIKRKKNPLPATQGSLIRVRRRDLINWLGTAHEGLLLNVEFFNDSDKSTSDSK